jgi:aspartate/methionine/tyrosine aminotransferase
MIGNRLSALPNFALEVYLGKHEFTAKHHLTASDAQTLSIAELLAYGGDEARSAFLNLDLGYTTTWGSPALREAIAATYDSVSPDEVLVFAGAQEAMYWTMQILVGPGDHVIVTVPNYQSMESVPLAAGAEVSGLALWEGEGSELRWTLDLDRLRTLLRPNTKAIAVNIPNNPTGYVPDAASLAELVALCDKRGIVLFSDEVYRGIELDESKRLGQVADLTPTGLSMNVMSKAYGLPGLRIGWLASKNKAVLAKLELAKHYTSICSSGPSEFLATLALQHGDKIRARNRLIMGGNLALFRDVMGRCTYMVEWSEPDGGCVLFPRYLGADGVEVFAESLVRERSAVVLPSSIYASQLLEIPNDRFRIGIGRSNPAVGWAQLEAHLASRPRSAPASSC